MKKGFLELFLIIFIIGLTMLYYNNSFNYDVDKLFVSLSTFLFALFTGFFISRQSGRYKEIRKLTADFDGIMSFLYRSVGHFSPKAQKEIGGIIKKHYRLILKNGWDYPFMHKTTTLTDIHKKSEEIVKKEGSDGIRGSVVSRIAVGLYESQKIRKNMVALRDERIPAFQWFLIAIVAIILVLTVSTIQSVGNLYGSLVKAAFISAILVTTVLLRRLDKLELFSGTIGEHSAKDVVDIIAGKK